MCCVPTHCVPPSRNTHIIFFGASPEVSAPSIAGNVEYSDSLKTGQRDWTPITLHRTEDNVTFISVVMLAGSNFKASPDYSVITIQTAEDSRILSRYCQAHMHWAGTEAHCLHKWMSSQDYRPCLHREITSSYNIRARKQLVHAYMLYQHHSEVTGLLSRISAFIQKEKASLQLLWWQK